MVLHPEDRRRAARTSLEGLAYGDAFGERFFPRLRPLPASLQLIADRTAPPEPRWHWTDDTAMALDLLAVLETHGEVVAQPLAQRFAATYRADPGRGYGSGMHALLPRVAAAPHAWEELAGLLFDGEGSLGNGAAMRVAPLGAWFHDDLDRVVDQAARSARVTTPTPRGRGRGRGGRGGGALRARRGAGPRRRRGPHPAGPVRDGLLRAAGLPPAAGPGQAAAELGSGRQIRADDTVPFALWCAARHPDDLESALWATAAGFGDVDTTCAVTGAWSRPVRASRRCRRSGGRAGSRCQKAEHPAAHLPGRIVRHRVVADARHGRDHRVRQGPSGPRGDPPDVVRPAAPRQQHQDRYAGPAQPAGVRPRPSDHLRVPERDRAPARQPHQFGRRRLPWASHSSSRRALGSPGRRNSGRARAR
ncbi:ADP-ribosylglycohydrolase family protein [Streptomyces lydicus]|nr:ADP-ribosylglycohydrolase family protein [Streptomyces lydicus]